MVVKAKAISEITYHLELDEIAKQKLRAYLAKAKDHDLKDIYHSLGGAVVETMYSVSADYTDIQ